jgi:hypothetical protein
MANYYTLHTAMAVVPCTEEQAKEAQRLLANSMPTGSPEADQWEEDHEHGFEALPVDGGIFLRTANEYSSIDALPDEFIAFIGQLLRAAVMPYLEIGEAQTCSKMRVASHGGGVSRIYASGKLVFPELIWREEKREQ